MREKIIVTGAAGFIGSHTVDQLLSAGHSVWGADNFRTGRRENLAAASQNKAFALTEIDVAEEKEFVDFVGSIQPTAIIHLAALVSVPESIANPALNHRLNLVATQVVAEAARRHDVGRLVFASSAAVYGNPSIIPTPEDSAKSPLSPYGAAKLASEELLFDHARGTGHTVRCQRYFNVYGPRQDPRSPYSGVISIFLDRLQRRASPKIFGDGEQTRDFISVVDVARANMVAATRADLPSGVANICTGREVPVNRLWSIMAIGLPTAPPPHYAEARGGDIRRSCGAPMVARSALGFEASVPLEIGLGALAAECIPQVAVVGGSSSA